MRYFFSFAILALIWSCSSNNRGDLITIPEFPTDFYRQSFDHMNNTLKKNPHNIDAAKQKVAYCQELGWPESCIDALELLRYHSGMSTNLIGFYYAYYQANSLDQRLVELIYRWDKIFNLKNKYHQDFIEALARLGWYDSLSREMPEYLRTHQNPEAFLIAAKSYLASEDSAIAIYYYSKIRNMGVFFRELGYEYPSLLFAKGYNEVALKSMREYSLMNPTDDDYAGQLSLKYEALGYLSEARNVILPFAEKKDTVIYRIASLYKDELKWDSAILYLDSLVLMNPKDKKALWTRARYYEDRGWLTYSLKFFDQVLAVDSADTLVNKRKAMINRKIAFLQRKKFEQSKVPILELKSKKIIED